MSTKIANNSKTSTTPDLTEANIKKVAQGLGSETPTYKALAEKLGINEKTLHNKSELKEWAVEARTEAELKPFLVRNRKNKTTVAEQLTAHITGLTNLLKENDPLDTLSVRQYRSFQNEVAELQQLLSA